MPQKPIQPYYLQYPIEAKVRKPLTAGSRKNLYAGHSVGKLEYL